MKNSLDGDYARSLGKLLQYPTVLMEKKSFFLPSLNLSCSSSCLVSLTHPPYITTKSLAPFSCRLPHRPWQAAVRSVLKPSLLWTEQIWSSNRRAAVSTMFPPIFQVFPVLWGLKSSRCALTRAEWEDNPSLGLLVVLLLARPRML